MKKLVLAVLAVTLGLLFYCSKMNEDTIVICSSAEQFRNDYFQEELKRRFPEYNIVIMYTATGKAAAKVAVEQENSETDILLGLDTGYLDKIKEHLADISGLSQLLFLEGLTPADNGNKWVTWEKSAGSIVVNTELCEKYGLPIPRSYEDLLNPIYQGLIAMPDPKSSGTGYFFYKSWVNAWGEEVALAYVDQLQKNLQQFTESGSGPIKLLLQGEVAVGLSMTFQAVNEINAGVPLQIIYPKEGAPYSLTGTAIIRTKDEKKGVKEVYEYLVNELLVYDKVHFSPEAILKDQKNEVPNYPQDIQYADMTGISSITEKERLLEKWKY